MKKLSFFLMAMLVSLTSFAAALGEGYEKVTNISTLAAGDKVVLYCDDSSIGVTGVNGTKDAAVAATGWVEYLVEAATGGVKLKDTNANKYISLTSKNTFTYANSGSVCKVNAQGVLYITLNGSDYFLYQNGSYYRMYVDKTGNSGYKPFYVYKVVPVEVDPDATMYTVTVKSADETMGTVTGGGEYAEGKTATLEASPKAGYEFVKWSNGSTENPLTITVTEDIELTATFQAQTPITIAEALALKTGTAFTLNQFTVTQVQGGNTYIKDASGYGVIYKYDLGLVAGDVVASMPGTTGFYYYSQIVPAVETVIGTAGSVPAPEVVMTAPTDEILYKYVKMENVTVASGVATFSDATKVTLYPAPADGKYESIVGSVGHYKGALQVVVANAIKAPTTYTVTVTAENGTVEGDGEYEEGATATLTATAASGYKFVNWTVEGEQVSTENPYSFEVTKDVTIVANFAKDQGTAVDNTMVANKAMKAIINGQLVIVKDGVRYNALGQVIK